MFELRVDYFSYYPIHFSPTEIDSNKKQTEMDRKAIDDLVRERDILNKNLLKVGPNCMRLGETQ